MTGEFRGAVAICLGTHAPGGSYIEAECAVWEHGLLVLYDRSDPLNRRIVAIYGPRHIESVTPRVKP